MAKADSTVIPVHLDDVVSYLNSCSDVFGQVSAILKIIEKESGQYSEIKKLARAGISLASEMENTSDCWREEIAINGVCHDERKEAIHG